RLQAGAFAHVADRGDADGPSFPGQGPAPHLDREHGAVPLDREVLVGLDSGGRDVPAYRGARLGSDELHDALADQLVEPEAQHVRELGVRVDEAAVRTQADPLPGRLREALPTLLAVTQRVLRPLALGRV